MVIYISRKGTSTEAWGGGFQATTPATVGMNRQTDGNNQSVVERECVTCHKSKHQSETLIAHRVKE